MEDLLTYIRTITEFQDKSWEYLSETLREMEFRKGDYLLRSGKTCQSIFFIRQGYCRAFHEKDGLEVNTAFYFEGEFATNIRSITRNEPSEYAIRSCEPLRVIQFNKDKLLQAYSQSHEIESFGRKLLGLTLSKMEDHADLFKLLSPQERYEYLLEHQPMIIKRVSLTQLASYLGVARETLSRIRGKNR